MTTTKQLAKLLAIMFGSAIVLSVGFIWLFTSGVMDVDGTPDKHIDTTEIGEIRNFTTVRYVSMERYEISGTVEYEGTGNYYIRASGWNVDDDRTLCIIGSTGDEVKTDVCYGYRNQAYDRDYTKVAEKWFESGV